MSATNEDFVHPGIIYGFRTIGDYDGDNIFYFGRSKQECFLNLDGDSAQQKEMLRRKGKFGGIGAPSRILLWARVEDIDEMWFMFKQELTRGWLRRPTAVGDIVPNITHQLSLGENWFQVDNVGVEDFGTWCRATMQRLLNGPRVFQVDVEM